MDVYIKEERGGKDKEREREQLDNDNISTNSYQQTDEKKDRQTDSQALHKEMIW